MPTKVWVDETVVVPLLVKMRLPRWVLLDLASKTAGERANVAPHEPPPVIGFETWRWGTRYCREEQELRKLGWVVCDDEQVSGIRNDAVGIKLVVCSTNGNTGNPRKAPRNISTRGPASCRLIGRNSGQIPMAFMATTPRPDLWYFCLGLSDQSIAIEVSRPDEEVGGFIKSFSDRIIVAKPGEIPGIRRITVPEDFADVPKPQVSRKPR
jgi:hypothetical protein